MNKLSDVNSKIEALHHEIFGRGKIDPIKNPHWERYEEVLNLTNEVSGVAFLVDEKKDFIEPRLHLIHETQANFFAKIRDENVRGYLSVKKYPGWTGSDYEKLYSLDVGDFKGAYEIAKNVIKRLKSDFDREEVWQVCGSINHGVMGKEQNIKILFESIFQLSRLGKKVFSQIPFIPIFDKWERELNWNPHDTVVVHNVFEPLFESRLINNLAFSKGFNDSFGATEEHESGMNLEHMNVYHLCTNFHLGEKEDGKKMMLIKQSELSKKEMVGE